MNLGEIREQCRIELDDVAPDYLWSDAELDNLINQAEAEASRRSRLIIDASTADICTIAVVAGTAVYPLSSKILRVLEAYPSWDTRPLRHAITKELNCRTGWRTETSARPDHVVKDWETGKLRLYPIPTEAGTLSLRVYRTPLERMQADDDVPEIKEAYHDKLVYWVKYRAYLKPDADTLNKNAAAEALAEFEREFGPPISAWAEEFDERNLPEDHLGQY